MWYTIWYTWDTMYTILFCGRCIPFRAYKQTTFILPSIHSIQFLTNVKFYKNLQISKIRVFKLINAEKPSKNEFLGLNKRFISYSTFILVKF